MDLLRLAAPRLGAQDCRHEIVEQGEGGLVLCFGARLARNLRVETDMMVLVILVVPLYPPSPRSN